MNFLSTFLLPLLKSYLVKPPCPYPRESILNLIPIYLYLDRANKYEIGSVPGLKTKIIGVVQEESLNDPLRSTTGDYINMQRIFSA